MTLNFRTAPALVQVTNVKSLEVAHKKIELDAHCLAGQRPIAVAGSLLTQKGHIVEICAHVSCLPRSCHPSL